METGVFSALMNISLYIFVFIVIVAFIVLISRKTWTFEYNGHKFLIKNRINGEKLFIDGELQDEHSGIFILPVASRLTGQIKSQDGAVEDVKVNLGPKIFTVSCVVFIDNKLVYKS